MVVADNLESPDYQGVLLRAGGEPHLRRDGAHYDRLCCRSALQARASGQRSKSPCRWRRAGIIAKLRNRRFFSLAKLNAAIAELVTPPTHRVTGTWARAGKRLFDE